MLCVASAIIDLVAEQLMEGLLVLLDTSALTIYMVIWPQHVTSSIPSYDERMIVSDGTLWQEGCALRELGQSKHPCLPVPSMTSS